MVGLVYCYFFLLFLMEFEDVNCLERNSISMTIHRKKRHSTGSVITQYSAGNTSPVRVRCAERCLRDLACISFNLNADGLCSLMGEILEDGELEDDQNNDFYGETL